MQINSPTATSAEFGCQHSFHQSLFPSLEITLPSDPLRAPRKQQKNIISVRIVFPFIFIYSGNLIDRVSVRFDARRWNGFSLRKRRKVTPSCVQDVRNSAPRRRVLNLINSAVARFPMARADINQDENSESRACARGRGRCSSGRVAAGIREYRGCRVGSRNEKKAKENTLGYPAAHQASFSSSSFYSRRDPGTSSIRSGQLDAGL